MVAKLMRHMLVVVVVLGVFALLAGHANAQCCGTGYTAFYQPTTFATAAPVVYTTNYNTGWYPGYWWNRVRTRLWGSPTTYVASFPSTYAVSYTPSYSVGYATSFATPACSSCSSCTSCGYSASYSPCSSCSNPCTSCSGCATDTVAPSVSQASYVDRPAGCSSCTSHAADTTPTPAPQSVPTPAPTPAPQRTFGQENGAPSLEPGVNVPAQRQQETQMPATNGAQQEVQPEPAAETKDPYEVDADSSTFFQAPKLFDPNDRTARRSIAPVTTALYEKPASYRQVSSRPISVQQAESDAAGWVSASN